MSNKSTAGSGYLVKAIELLPLLPKEVQDEYDQYVADLECDEAMGILDRHLPIEFARPAQIFILGHDDHGDELVQEVPYACWGTDDLFVKTPTERHTALVEKGVKPSHFRWTMWG